MLKCTIHNPLGINDDFTQNKVGFAYLPNKQCVAKAERNGR